MEIQMWKVWQLKWSHQKGSKTDWHARTTNEPEGGSYKSEEEDERKENRATVTM
jgi:hypothetical protein